MRIIDKVEIAYFRSVYSLSLTDNRDVNVFVGGNDAGKSNLLKALNLFFNNQTGFQEPYDFLSDLCRYREDEARRAKGRASIWIKVTFNNFVNWKALPDKFTVKRQWNRYSSIPIDTYPSKSHSITVSKFLGKIQFHYIPAVKSREIFTHYLTLLHDSLIEDERAGVRVSSAELMRTINQSTEDMSDQILEGLGLDSKIQVPEDLRELFKALDFSTQFSGYEIPLQRRGDGIQVRHIPYILDFIARHSRKFHIWAYEEPENSLEMSRAFELSEQFEEVYSKENQIYLTTHSPAFYDLVGNGVQRWSVSSDPQGTNDELTTSASKISASDAPDAALGVAALVAKRSRQLHEEVKSLRESVSDLKTAVAIADQPQVVVEGPTDVAILQAAYNAIYDGADVPFELLSATGAPNVSAFIKSVSTLKRRSNQPVVGLVDFDSAGRAALKYFEKYKRFGETQFRVVDKVEHIYFGALPVPEEFIAVDETFKRLTNDGSRIPLCIEFMFPPEVIADAIEDDVLVLRDRLAKGRDGEIALPINLTSACADHLEEEYIHFAKAIDDACKERFAEWAIGLPAEDFENFEVLFDVLSELVTGCD